MTRNISRDILETIDHGAVNGVSIVANGCDFDFSVEEIRKRPHIRSAVHLNIVEGPPVCPKEELPDLVNDNNMFKNQFGSLLLMYLRTSKAGKMHFKQQIRKEFSAQIDRFIEGTGQTGPINIDSHQHVHLLPFVAEVLMELSEEYSFQYVRLIREPVFRIINFKSFRHGMGINLVKLGLLRWLSISLEASLKERNISYCGYFFGVGFSGNMSVENSIAWLAGISKEKFDKIEHCEILFHPGSTIPQENSFWNGERGFLDFYEAIGRKQEKNSLLAKAGKIQSSAP